MKVFDTIKGAAIILIVSVIVGTLLLTLAFLLPTGPIRFNILSTANELAKEGDYHTVYAGIVTTGVDNYTDAVILNESLFGFDDGSSSFRTVLDGDLYVCDENIEATGQLALIVENGYSGELEVQHLFKRFWNGYLVPLKLCLTRMNYYAIRYMNFVIQLALMAALCGLLYKRKLMKYSIPIVLAYIWMNPISMSVCLTFSAFYYCAVIPAILMLAFHEQLSVGSRYLWFFEGAGICTIYFCMNYIQLLSFLFPLAIYIFLNEKTMSAGELLKKCLWLAFFWFGGYYGMMGAKWVVYGIFVDWSIFAEIFDNVILRLSSSYREISITRTGAVLRNINTALGSEANNLTEGCFILVCLIMMLKKHKLAFKKAYIAIFAFSCVLPVARYFIFANHVYTHHWIMFRLLVIPVFCLNVILTRMITGSDPEKTEQRPEESGAYE